MIVVHRSNRAERLVEALAGVLATPAAGQSPDPFAPEVVVVPSRGMERWVSMRLADAHGVWANPSFPFPRAIIERILDVVLGEAPEAARWTPDALQWSIAASLPARLTEPAFEPVARYLHDDVGAERLLELSERLSGLFDNYLVFRPRPDDIVARWARGEDVDDFQAALFRTLLERIGDAHVAGRALRCIEALGRGQGPVDGLPPRLSLFAISALPPLYLRLFEALARRIELHLFMLSPTEAYWADIRPLGELDADEADAQHIDEGHPLLASLGLVAQDFHRLLEDGVAYVEGAGTAYVDAGSDSLLHALQSDILHLRARGAGGAPRHVVAEGDESIRIHACHGPMREVEVLHDQLVACMDATGVEPHEIVVMAPDIEAYAPLVDAVFGETTGRPRIPYRIADRRVRSTHALVDAFDAVLEVLAGRMPAGEVLDLLGRPAVRARFDIEDAELLRLREWVADSGIRWAEDAEHRQSVGQPRLEDHTFRFGLERMWLGVAMEGHGHRTFAGRMPFDGIEGADAELLARFSQFCESLFECRKRVSGARDPADWQKVLLGVMDALLRAEGAQVEELQAIRNGLQAVVDAAQAAGFTEPLSLAALRGRLGGSIEQRAQAHGFLTGGVTFCQLVPMRSIPFRVVCLLGMNDDDYPRRPPRLGFDRMEVDGARRGDRNPGAEDRFLFLEALLSARERLIVTYQGRGIHDNAVRPPSVLVGDLIGVLGRCSVFPGEDGGDAADRAAAAERYLTVPHRLQPFSPQYFSGTDPRYFSYASHYFRGATRVGERRSVAPFVDGAVATDGSIKEIALEQLARFVERPVRYFLQRRLGLYLEEEHVLLEPREPADVDALGKWQLGDRLLAAAREGRPPADALPLLRAAGALPPGSPGALDFADALPAIEAIARREQELTGGAAPRPPLPFALPFGGVRLHGTLRSLWPDAQVRVQFSRIGRRQELRFWLRHLVCCALRSEGRELPTRTHVVGRPESGDGVGEVRFGEVADAAAQLGTLLELHLAGQAFPLPFSWNASAAYANAIAAGRDHDDALSGAREAFQRDEYRDAGERRVYPDFEALLAPPGPHDFAQLALSILAPWLAGREVV